MNVGVALTLFLAGAGGAGFLVAGQKGPSRAQAALELELKAARAEGIITSVDEFLAKRPKLEDKLNAAPLYEKLEGFRRTSFGPVVSCLRDASTGQPDARSRARSLLEEHKGIVRLLDEAAEFPSLRLNHDWSDGIVLIFPAGSVVRQASALLLLRGFLAAAENPDLALADVRKVFRLSKQIADNGTDIAPHIRYAMEVRAADQLLVWAMRYPEHRKTYRKALEEVASGIAFDIKGA